jgi:catechol 2,3-dioxygenase-like lactoylglutathione lyase family enzyme
MDQRISLVTLAVEALEVERAFYEALGWQAVDRTEDLVVFDLLGQSLGLYRASAMARDMGLGEDELRPGGQTLSVNVRGAADVQPVLDAVRAAGGTVLRDAHEVFWGGTVGFFRAPAGHLWEVAHNPSAPLAADGRFRWRGFGEPDGAATTS